MALYYTVTLLFYSKVCIIEKSRCIIQARVHVPFEIGTAGTCTFSCLGTKLVCTFSISIVLNFSISVVGGRSRNRVSEQRNRSIYQSRYLWYLFKGTAGTSGTF